MFFRTPKYAVRVFEDSGILGAKGRDARPGLDALMKGVWRKKSSSRRES
jgi:hypothetical protein